MFIPILSLRSPYILRGFQTHISPRYTHLSIFGKLPLVARHNMHLCPLVLRRKLRHGRKAVRQRASTYYAANLTTASNDEDVYKAEHINALETHNSEHSHFIDTSLT
jgi:hypothetical protein